MLRYPVFHLYRPGVFPSGPHLQQYAPLWLVTETVDIEEGTVQFDVVFRHNRYGWVNRRYRYDSVDDVLYHKGQTNVTEERVMALQSKSPYVDAVVANTPNAYGG